MHIKKILFITASLLFITFSYAAEKSFFNELADFFTSKNIVIEEIGKSELFLPGGFEKIKKQEVDLVYMDNTDYFGFGGPTSLAYAYVLFNENARKKLAIAEKLYLSDFENKRLDRKGKRTDKLYGHTPTKFIWGTIKMQAKNTGITETSFGYKF